MKSRFTILFALFAFVKIYSQFDIARIEVVHIPKGNKQDIEYNRVRGLFNVPIKVNEKAHLILGADYSVIDFIFIEPLQLDTEKLKDFQSFEVNFGFTQKLKKNWRIAVTAKPGVTTNSVKNTAFLKEVKLSGGVLFFKDEKEAKKYDLLLGIYYNAFNGFSFPLPFIKYHKIITRHWSYDLGFPRINLEYKFNNKHAVKAYTTIDGFNSNLVEAITITNGVVEKFNATVLVAGLKYDFIIKKHLEYYLATGYILNNEINFRDNNAENLFKIKGNNAIYLRTGIRIKI